MAILGFFRVKQRKQLVLQCFEAVSTVWGWHITNPQMLVFAVFTVGMVNKAFLICQLHFTLSFLGIFRKPKMPHYTCIYTYLAGTNWGYGLEASGTAIFTVSEKHSSEGTAVCVCGDVDVTVHSHCHMSLHVSTGDGHARGMA